MVIVNKTNMYSREQIDRAQSQGSIHAPILFLSSSSDIVAKYLGWPNTDTTPFWFKVQHLDERDGDAQAPLLPMPVQAQAGTPWRALDVIAVLLREYITMERLAAGEHVAMVRLAAAVGIVIFFFTIS